MQPKKRIFAGIFAMIGFIGVLLQFISTYEADETTWYAHIIHFGSFFTIITNTIVAFYFLAHYRQTETRWTRFFRQPEVGTAITVYILIVGLVYQIILRKPNQPPGLMLYSDHVVHGVMPIAALIFWGLYISMQPINIRSIPKWLIYPLLYFGYTLLRGIVTHYYPYPFMQVPQLGYGQVALNCGAIMCVFLLFSLLFSAFANWRHRKSIQ